MTAQRDAFDRAIAAWNAGDLDGYLELYDDRTALHGYTEHPLTKPEIGAFYANLFAAMADIVLEIHEVVEAGPRLACRFTLHGTHTGELFGISPTGRRINGRGITILRFAGDRVVERHSVGEFDAIVAQLTAD